MKTNTIIPKSDIRQDSPAAPTQAAPSVSEQDERALYEAWELAEAARLKGEPLTADEREFVLKRWTRDTDTYERCPHHWPAFKAGYRAALNQSAQAAQGGGVQADVREFVEAIAGPCFNYIDRETDQTCCSGCNEPEVYRGALEPAEEAHREGCIVLRARAYLAANPAPSAAPEPVGEVVANHPVHGWHMRALKPWDEIGAGTKLYAAHQASAQGEGDGNG